MSTYPPFVDLTQDGCYYISGDVSVAAGVSIASGVLLQADPGSQILIKAGVCIGMGTIVHAHEGILTIDQGATLGTSVLIIGQGIIGNHACIGSGTTIFNSSIDPRSVIPHGSLIVESLIDKSLTDRSLIDRSLINKSLTDRSLIDRSLINKSLTDRSLIEIDKTDSSLEEVFPDAKVQPADPVTHVAATVSPPSEGQAKRIPGQAHLSQLLLKIYPYRQAAPDGTS